MQVGDDCLQGKILILVGSDRKAVPGARDNDDLRTDPSAVKEPVKWNRSDFTVLDPVARWDKEPKRSKILLDLCGSCGGKQITFQDHCRASLFAHIPASQEARRSNCARVKPRFH